MSNEEKDDGNVSIIVDSYEADGKTPREWCAFFDRNMNSCQKKQAKWARIVTWIHGYREVIIGLVNQPQSEYEQMQDKIEEETGRKVGMILDAIEKEAN